MKDSQSSCFVGTQCLDSQNPGDSAGKRHVVPEPLHTFSDFFLPRAAFERAILPGELLKESSCPQRRKLRVDRKVQLLLNPELSLPLLSAFLWVPLPVVAWLQSVWDGVAGGALQTPTLGREGAWLEQTIWDRAQED